MPSRKYKHIKVPTSLFSRENRHIPSTGRNFKELGHFNKDKHKRKVLRGVNRINQFFSQRDKLFRDTDKQINEIKIKFHGPVNKDFIFRYKIDIYRQEENKAKDSTIYGKISNKKIGGQKSDFEHLENEVDDYVKREERRSYFEKIKELEPLTLEEIIEKDLNKRFKKHPNQEVYIDVSFADRQNVAATKLDFIEKEFANKFISKVNTELLHFCRLKAKYSDIRKLHKSYKGIIDIEQAPDYRLLTSSIEKNIEHLNIVPPSDDGEPAFVLDGAINPKHITLNNALTRTVGAHTGNKKHATAVASLVVCGTDLDIQGNIQQNNKVVAVDISDGRDGFLKLEEKIVDTVEQNSPNYQLLLINFSINNYYFYRRKKVDKLTRLLDELAYKYNCLFFVSTGNLFSRDWTSSVKQLIRQTGYPRYFNEKICRIVPPADSINNISVGSITYRESVNSIAKIRNPAPITRANINGMPFVKPDFVHYDSNYKRDFTCEFDGVYLASDDTNKLTRWSGTSFATPLVLHDACLLHNFYPSYNKNTIKALLIHFADLIPCEDIPVNMRKKLTGFGMPNLEKALYSLNSSSTLIIEDKIGINKKKNIRFPVPDCISGSGRKRLKIRKTLAYTPKINPKNVRTYNPINISVRFVRGNNTSLGNSYTRSAEDGAHQKSNIKSFPPIEVATRQHTGEFWTLSVICESRDDTLPTDYKQAYSIVLSLEDLLADESINLHQEILNMIEIETSIEVPINISI